MSRKEEADQATDQAVGCQNDVDMDERDDWRNITDPSARRKAQNRIAQRKYRDKMRKQNVEKTYIEANQAAAGSAYSTTDPDDLRSNDNPSGLPWGSINMRDVVEKGKAREQGSQQSGAGSSPTIANN